MAPVVTCAACGGPERLTPPVYQVIIWCALFDGGIYHLTPAESYCVCEHDGCRAPKEFLRRAMDSHPETRQAMDLYTDALIVWRDPKVQPWKIQHDFTGAQA